MGKRQYIVFSAALGLTLLDRLRDQPGDGRSRARARIGRSGDRDRGGAIRAVAADARRRVRARSGAHGLRRRCRPEARRSQRSTAAIRVRRSQQLRPERMGIAGRQDRGESRLADRAQLRSGARRRARPRDRACGRAPRRARDAARTLAASRLARNPSRGAATATTAASPSERRASARSCCRCATAAKRSSNPIFTACATWLLQATTRAPPSRCRKRSCACPNKVAATAAA